MSLIPTYAQSREGNWYRNPTIRADDGSWFVCWDDREPVELVVKRGEWKPSEVVERLRDLGWDVFTISAPQNHGSRYFDGKLHKAARVFLGQDGGPPETLLPDEARGEPKRDCVKYPNHRVIA